MAAADRERHQVLHKAERNEKDRVVETRKAEGKDILSDEVIEADYDKEIERPITPEELSHRRRSLRALPLALVRGNAIKKVKQNFPMKNFLGDNENVIKIQIWVTMIAYLLMKVLQHKSKSKLAFSNLVTTVRITICSYTDIVMLLNNPKVE